MKFTTAIYGFAFALTCMTSVNAKAQNQDNGVEITDEYLISFLKDYSTLWDMSNKRVILGNHNGNSVVADHPCSDLCPMYTIRVIHYEVPINDCKNKGGLIASIVIPQGISRLPKDYCVPAVIKAHIYLGKPNEINSSNAHSASIFKSPRKTKAQLKNDPNRHIRQQLLEFYGVQEKEKE